MKLVSYLFYGIILMYSDTAFAQYEFSGYVDTSDWSDGVYLSLVEDYRKISGIYPEQIIQKVTPDATGYFVFTGDNLPEGNHMYRIHVDKCSQKHKNRAHLNGFCTDSEEALFIANHTDTLSLPFSFDKEIFCKIVSNNEKSNAFIKIDSIIDEMRFAFGNYRSTANRKINSSKWMNTLQENGKSLNEPLIELYVFAFLSNKTNELYSHYLDDLKNNPYYDELLERLLESYPNSTYVIQYEAELASDKFLINPKENSSKNPWIWLLIIVLILSLSFNILQFLNKRKEASISSPLEKNLTQQEQKVLDLILEDKTNKEIASTMFVSLSTIKTHINNLYKKLEVSSREEVKSLYIKK